jgi:NTP pyrophosphatase (non-canonical NTP hydrolase)
MRKRKVEIQRAIETLVENVHSCMVSKGYYAKPREFGTLVALCHSELSEALEAHRRGCATVAEELADCIIRICDLAGAEQLPLAKALMRKLNRNETQPPNQDKEY